MIVPNVPAKAIAPMLRTEGAAAPIVVEVIPVSPDAGRYPARSMP